jgi:hypothetical protein
VTHLLVRLALLLAIGTTAGCFQTSVQTGRASDGATHRDRQWFAVGGLFRLSDPAHAACPAGLARADSMLSVPDTLINAGIAVAGALAGALACDGDDGACATAGASLAPFLLASRTVDYECAAGPTAARMTLPDGDQGRVALRPLFRNQVAASETSLASSN